MGSEGGRGDMDRRARNPTLVVSKQVVSKHNRMMRWVATTILVAVLLGLGSPLVVRGPVLRWIFARALASRCGHFSIAGGHFGWATLLQFAVGRPFSLTIERIVITDPNDKLVLEAARVQALTRVSFSPLRIEVVAARIADGIWRWAGSEAGGTADTFRALPAGGRQACLAPQETPQSPPRPVRVTIENARLEDLDIDLDFVPWQLELSRVTTNLRMSVDGRLRFRLARTVAAGGGRLRIGPVGAEWTTTTPFDTVSFDSFGTVSEAPSDLELVLESARTGRSDLSGRAVFHQVFPDASQHPRPAGLDVEARWRSFGEALSRLQADWLSHREWLKRIGHDLQFGIHGPYRELSVATSVEAARARVEAELAHGLATLHMNFSGVDTSAWFGPALGRLLSGRLRGGLLASLRLAPSFAGLTAGIVNADLRLERNETTNGPRTLVLRIGSSQPVPASPGLLSANIAQLRLSKGRLQLVGAQAVWTRLSARAEANIDFSLSDWSGSRLDARGSLAVASLADWIPAPIAQGRFRVVGDVSGTLRALWLQARISPTSVLVLGGQRFGLPDRLALQWSESRGLLVPQLRLRTDTGFIGLRGRVDPNHRVEAEILLSRYSPAELPWFADDSVAGSFGALLSGRLLLEGPVGRPSVRGTISTPSLDFRGRSLGSATATLTVGQIGGEGELRVGPSLTARVNLRHAPRLSIDTRILLHKQALRPWLPPELALPSIAASGTAHLAYREGRPWVGDATLEVEGPGLEGAKVVARAQAEDMSADITGQVSLAPWRTFWSRTLTDAQGTMGIEVTVRHDQRGTRLSGELLAVQDVTLRLSHRYGPIRFLAGDRLGFEDRTFSSQGLQVELPWFRGRVSGHMTIEPDLSRSLIDAGVAGVLDLRAFPVRLLQPTLTLGGRAAIDATVTGSLGPTPGPQIHGQVDLEQVRVALPDFPALVINGRVHAQGEHLSTQSLNVEIARTGRIIVGAPKSPATAVLASLLPLRLGQVDAPFWGSNLVIGSPRSPVEIGDLDINARYHGLPGDHTLSGQVDVSRGWLRPGRVQGAHGTEQRPWYQSLPPGLTLDLEIRGLNHAMEVAIPWVPDVTADFDCRLRATRQGAHWSGRVYGAGLYDRMAFRLYSWFGDRGVLHCQLGAKK